jgi:hypothetical protein
MQQQLGRLSLTPMALARFLRQEQNLNLFDSDNWNNQSQQQILITHYSIMYSRLNSNRTIKELNKINIYVAYLEEIEALTVGRKIIIKVSSIYDEMALLWRIR